MIRLVEAESVADFLNRYYKPERLKPTTLGSYLEDFEKNGCVTCSGHDNVVGDLICWPRPPAWVLQHDVEIIDHQTNARITRAGLHSAFASLEGHGALRHARPLEANRFAYDVASIERACMTLRGALTRFVGEHSVFLHIGDSGEVSIRRRDPEGDLVLGTFQLDDVPAIEHGSSETWTDEEGFLRGVKS